MWLLKIIGFPISVIYGVVVWVRNYCYDKGIFSSSSFKTPTVCIGNLSVGGTGKTPMVEFLVRSLQDEYKVAILSRGYGRKSKGYVQANNHSTVEELGDEPYQIHQKFPKISFSVDANRREGVQRIEAEIKPDVILLDDAYQHRKVKASSYILLTAYYNLYVNDWFLPTGSLRDAKVQAARASVIIVTKCPRTLSIEEQQQLTRKLNPLPHQQVLFSYLGYASEVKNEDTHTLPLEALKDKKVCLVTGIANAAPLVAYLKEKGVAVEHLEYRDHHFFTDKEIEIFNTKAFVLTTEKDFVRLKGKVTKLYYLEIEHCFLGNGAKQLKQEVIKLLNPNS